MIIFIVLYYAVLFLLENNTTKKENYNLVKAKNYIHDKC